MILLLLSVLRTTAIGAAALAYALLLWIAADTRLRWRATLLGAAARAEPQARHTSATSSAETRQHE